MGIDICIERSGRDIEGEHTRRKEAGAVIGRNGEGALHQNSESLIRSQER